MHSSDLQEKMLPIQSHDFLMIIFQENALISLSTTGSSLNCYPTGENNADGQQLRDDHPKQI
jgi:hypothetical protein